MNADTTTTTGCDCQVSEAQLGRRARLSTIRPVDYMSGCPVEQTSISCAAVPGSLIGMRLTLPEPAPWIEGLPRDSRGFVVPAEAGWENGTPILAKVGQDRKVALGMRRACAVCGYEMPRGSHVYRAFAQGDAAEIRMNERDRSEDPSGPLHLSCILYSSMVCPYLRERTSRLAKSSDVNPGGRRGTRAAIMGFKNFGIMMPAWNHQFLDPAPHFAYLKLIEDIGYKDGGELADRYAAAVEADAAIIDVAKPRLFWTSDEQDQRNLGRALKADFATISRADPDYFTELLGQGRFGVIEL